MTETIDFVLYHMYTCQRNDSVAWYAYICAPQYRLFCEKCIVSNVMQEYVRRGRLHALMKEQLFLLETVPVIMSVHS